jgi:hypothetical protein
VDKIFLSIILKSISIFNHIFPRFFIIFFLSWLDPKMLSFENNFFNSQVLIGKIDREKLKKGKVVRNLLESISLGIEIFIVLEGEVFE